MEDLTPNSPEVTPTLSLERPALGHLMEISRWGKFLAILGFIALGLLVVLAIFYGTILNSLTSSGLDSKVAGLTWIVSIIYVVIAAIFFFPVWYLFKFSSQIETSIRSKNTQELTAAFSNLKSVFKFMGIYSIVMLGLYALAMIGVFFGVAMS